MTTSRRTLRSSPDEMAVLPTRRGLLARLFGATTVGALASQGSVRADEAGVPRVAYHLADVDKVTFVLGNIENHIEGMGGPDKVHIVLVVHGPALMLLKARSATADVSRK